MKIKTADIENLTKAIFLSSYIPYRTAFTTALLTAAFDSHGCVWSLAITPAMVCGQFPNKKSK